MQLTVVVPVTPFMVAAAYIWGAPWSYVLVSLGVIGSAACGFFLSRFVVRPQVQRIFSNRQEVQRICAAVGQQGFRVALLCRLSLVLPTAVGTFVLGALTDIRFLDFFGATLLGSVPEAWAVVYLASSVKGSMSHGQLPWYVYLVAVVAVLMLVSTIARIAKSALDKSIEP
ncbi:unnamed protein product [Prorocentrum cordatum]|uniref:VTT domain-containing protein n=1 Tax=Prorocentrum cordatum TaxID=2364126 RepID=A0ABN9VBM3_9DINO|nr:unnamed protein product [Polarella glacialis]